MLEPEYRAWANTSCAQRAFPMLGVRHGEQRCPGQPQEAKEHLAARVTEVGMGPPNLRADVIRHVAKVHAGRRAQVDRLADGDQLDVLVVAHGSSGLLDGIGDVAQHIVGAPLICRWSLAGRHKDLLVGVVVPLTAVVAREILGNLGW